MWVPVFFGISLTDDVERLGGLAALEGDAVDFPATRDVSAEPIGEGVHAFGADTVEATRVFVGTLPEFSPGVETGQHELDGRHAELLMHVHGDTAAIVGDGNGTVDVDGNFDF